MTSFDQTHYRPLGTTGLRLSPLGLGTVKIGRNTDVKYPASFLLPTDAEVTELFTTAQSLGINLLDTAPAYGSSESRIGELLDRTQWDPLICTKVGENYSHGRSDFDFSRAAIEHSLQTSLTRLKRDQLDIVLIHCPDDDLHILEHSEVIQVLREYQSQGLIGAIGASTKSVAAGLLAVQTLDVVMLSYNLHDQNQLPVIELAQASNKGVLLKKVLQSGHDADPAVAIRFALANPAVTSAIVGTITPEHLASNAAALFANK